MIGYSSRPGNRRRGWVKKTFRRWVLSLYVALTAVSCCAADPLVTRVEIPSIAPLALTPSGRIVFPPIDESSGLVKSRRYPNVFWTHNDSGDEARIFAIRRDGSVIVPSDGEKYEGVRIPNARNVDWEDIAIDDAGHLIIGDIGNNGNRRKNLSIYFVEEPDPAKATTASTIRRVRFAYPDQIDFPPREPNFDSEALFWSRGKIYLLTKHWGDNYTKMYRFDSMDPSRVNRLTKIGTFDVRGQVTGADASPDGMKLAVLTYSSIWLFERPEGSDDYFSGRISWLPIQPNQYEAICFDGDKLLIGTEQRALFEIDLDRLIVVRDRRSPNAG
jgi:hypothetical protein